MPRYNLPQLSLLQETMCSGTVRDLGTQASTNNFATRDAKSTGNGPRAAILAEAAIADFTITPTPYFQGVKFLPTRESTH